jgi:hypothetical protein
MIRELVPPETRLAFAAMQALRTELASEESFAQEVDQAQRPEGYRLVAAFEEDESQAVAVGTGARRATSRVSPEGVCK